MRVRTEGASSTALFEHGFYLPEATSVIGRKHMPLDQGIAWPLTNRMTMGVSYDIDALVIVTD